jgi:emfourin
LRIRLQSEGGFGYFPGLDGPVLVDTADLPPDEAAGLERLVGATDFFARPARVDATPPPGPGAADQRRYTITVEDAGGRTHTVEVAEPVADAALQALIDSLRAARRAPGDR